MENSLLIALIIVVLLRIIDKNFPLHLLFEPKLKPFKCTEFERGTRTFTPGKPHPALSKGEGSKSFDVFSDPKFGRPWYVDPALEPKQSTTDPFELFRDRTNQFGEKKKVFFTSSPHNEGSYIIPNGPVYTPNLYRRTGIIGPSRLAIDNFIKGHLNTEPSATKFIKITDYPGLGLLTGLPLKEIYVLPGSPEQIYKSPMLLSASRCFGYKVIYYGEQINLPIE